MNFKFASSLNSSITIGIDNIISELQKRRSLYPQAQVYNTYLSYWINQAIWYIYKCPHGLSKVCCSITLQEGKAVEVLFDSFFLGKKKWDGWKWSQELKGQVSCAGLVSGGVLLMDSIILNNVPY